MYPEPVQVRDVLRRAIEICEADARARRVQIDADLDGAAALPLSADPARLQQVFWNLLKNAIKFSPVAGRIVVRCTERDGIVRVAVSDEGIGIAPEAREKIFDAFAQADATVSRQFGGLGLGLAISREIVMQHGGTVRAESPGPGRGSTFIVDLPRTVACELPPAPSTNSDSPLSRGAPRPQRGLRILLTEDHLDTARTLARLLSTSGHRITSAHTVADALRALDDGPFDLLLSDLGLPDGSGCDVMTRARTAGTPGICMSGFGAEADLERTRLAGFAAHLVKPINIEELDAAITRLAVPAADDLQRTDLPAR
jgi:CheY-like chemotaxis protein